MSTEVSALRLPYGKQWIEEDDIAAVVAVLNSDWLTTGPNVGIFEGAFAAATGAAEAVAVSSGTAALHAAMHALGIGLADEVIVPAMTFAASSNCILYQGGTPVFADVEPDTLLVDPRSVESLIGPRTKAVIGVDYAGQPCDWDALRALCDRRGLALVADSCHSLGASYKGRIVGTLADLSVFSLHPVKPITTGEGGVITTGDPELARKMRVFRNHGITTDHRQREARGSWFYEMVELGFNYRITDFQCALGSSQLRKLPKWVARRQALARRYDEALAEVPGVSPLAVRPENTHAYHLYVVRLDQAERGAVFQALRAAGIFAQVHYIPVHLHPYYREKVGTRPGQCPSAEAACDQILSLPMFPRMLDEHVDYVVAALGRAIRG